MINKPAIGDTSIFIEPRMWLDVIHKQFCWLVVLTVLKKSCLKPPTRYIIKWNIYIYIYYIHFMGI